MRGSAIFCRMRNGRKPLLPVVALVLGLSGCQSENRTAAAMTGGNPSRGAVAIRRYGCGSCHTVPGIPGAHGLVGPSLAHVSEQMYIGGVLPNAPDGMAHWIEDPHSVNEKTVMPNVGVTPRDAADIVAYLYSLK